MDDKTRNCAEVADVELVRVERELRRAAEQVQLGPDSVPVRALLRSAADCVDQARAYLAELLEDECP